MIHEIGLVNIRGLSPVFDTWVKIPRGYLVTKCKIKNIGEELSMILKRRSGGRVGGK